MASAGIGPTTSVSLARYSSSQWEACEGYVGAAHTKQDLAGLPQSRCCSHPLGRAQKVLDQSPGSGGWETPADEVCVGGLL